jgi:hypothetical protein
MRLSPTLTTSAAAAAGALVLVLGAPSASAAPGAPNENSSCLAKTFQRQAVEAPQTVSNRIKEIREFYLGDTPFGQALQPLAHLKDCSSLQ